MTGAQLELARELRDIRPDYQRVAELLALVPSPTAAEMARERAARTVTDPEWTVHGVG